MIHCANAINRFIIQFSFVSRGYGCNHPGEDERARGSRSSALNKGTMEALLVTKRFVLNERSIEVVSKGPSTNFYCSLFVEKNPFEHNLCWKSGPGFERVKIEWLTIPRNFNIFFKRFVSNERYIEVVSEGPLTNIYWSLFVEKYPFVQICAQKAARISKRSKLSGSPFPGISILFSSGLF